MQAIPSVMQRSSLLPGALVNFGKSKVPRDTNPYSPANMARETRRDKMVFPFLAMLTAMMSLLTVASESSFRRLERPHSSSAGKSNNDAIAFNQTKPGEPKKKVTPPPKAPVDETLLYSPGARPIF